MITHIKCKVKNLKKYSIYKKVNGLNFFGLKKIIINEITNKERNFEQVLFHYKKDKRVRRSRDKSRKTQEVGEIHV